MDVNQMRTFLLSATKLNFSKAAAELHLTQPAVTQQIKSLEEELNEPLFERLGRSLALTPAGEVFLVYVQQILNLTDQATETVRQFSHQRGRLTIAAGTTNTIFRLPDILQQYHHHYPQIEIRIRNGDSELINRLVHENAVDLGLVTTIDPTLNVTTVPLFADPIRLIAPTHYPTRISQEELVKESLVLFRVGSGFYRFLEEQFVKYNFVPRITIELESIEAIIRLVKSGLGLAFLPEIAVQEELQSGSLKIVTIADWQEMSRQTYLIHRPDKYLTWPIKAFLALIENF